MTDPSILCVAITGSLPARVRRAARIAEGQERPAAPWQQARAIAGLRIA